MTLRAERQSTRMSKITNAGTTDKTTDNEIDSQHC